MADFVNSAVLVTLQSPPNAKVRGLVQNIYDHRLFLSDVLWIASGRRTKDFEISSSNILDLEVIADEASNDHGTGGQDTSPKQNKPVPKPTMQEPPQHLLDPAILSVRKPSSTKSIESIATATLSEPFNDLSVAKGPQTGSDTAELGGHETKAVASRETERKVETKVVTPAEPASVAAPRTVLSKALEKAPRAQQNQSPQTRGKQERTESGTVKSQAIGSKQQGPRSGESKKKPKKGAREPHGRGARKAEAQNGWATEEATDIQELGDFDFVGNLSKFDKREVFRKLKEDDTVAESSRLVSHNRLPRAGTAGGKNLHWTENVLDPPRVASADWNSEAGESPGDTSDPKGNSDHSPKRAISRTSLRHAPVRRGSAKTETGTVISRTAINTSVGGRQPSFEIIASPRSKGRRSIPTSPFVGTDPAPRPSLRLQGSKKVCPCLSPLQIYELEQFSIGELGLSDDILMENAGRGIAEAAIRTLESEDAAMDPFGSRIVVIAGNHRSGIRALAAGRHLRNHGFKVTTTVMGLDRDQDLLDGVRKQANAYRKAGGYLPKPAELLDGINTGSMRPNMVIDALLGMHASFDDLKNDEQAWCFEIINAINRIETRVLSVDVPSGIDASNGGVTFAEGQPLAFHAHAIVSLGAPKSWLLAMLKGALAGDSPNLFVADIGISSIAWKRLGNRRSKGVEFGGKWLVKLVYQPA